MKNTFGVAICMVILASGCASSGTKFDENAVDSMQPGVTTLSEATKTLGKPYSTNFAADGTQEVKWAYASSSPLGIKSQIVAILFDKDGKMIRVTGKGGLH